MNLPAASLNDFEGESREMLKFLCYAMPAFTASGPDISSKLSMLFRYRARSKTHGLALVLFRQDLNLQLLKPLDDIVCDGFSLPNCVEIHVPHCKQRLAKAQQHPGSCRGADLCLLWRGDLRLQLFAAVHQQLLRHASLLICHGDSTFQSRPVEQPPLAHMVLRNLQPRSLGQTAQCLTNTYCNAFADRLIH